MIGDMRFFMLTARNGRWLSGISPGLPVGRGLGQPRVGRVEDGWGVGLCRGRHSEDQRKQKWGQLIGLILPFKLCRFPMDGREYIVQAVGASAV